MIMMMMIDITINAVEGEKIIDIHPRRHTEETEIEVAIVTIIIMLPPQHAHLPCQALIMITGSSSSSSSVVIVDNVMMIVEGTGMQLQDLKIMIIHLHKDETMFHKEEEEINNPHQHPHHHGRLKLHNL